MQLSGDLAQSRADCVNLRDEVDRLENEKASLQSKMEQELQSLQSKMDHEISAL